MNAEKRQLFLVEHPVFKELAPNTLSVRECVSLKRQEWQPSEESLWVAGRLVRMRGSSLWLSTDGLEVEFQCIQNGAPPTVRSQSELEAWQDVLMEGDILALELAHVQGTQEGVRPFKFKGVRVLVPNQASAPLTTQFTDTQSRAWMKFLHEIRRFFLERDFVEVRTPTLVASPGLEPFLEPFETQLEIGMKSQKVYLPTSPEFHLKKMLTLGWTRIFEMKECFRNGECTPHHQPEFLMLEWYRGYSNLNAIRADLKALLRTLMNLWGHPLLEIEDVTVAELFRRHCDFELTPSTTRESLLELAERTRTPVEASDSWDDIFFRLFLVHIEAHLGVSKLQIVSAYPPSQAALARLTPQGWADRFEFYWQGLEIANAFHELNDPTEQRRRFQMDQEVRKSRGRPIVPVDPEFLRALDYGLPPSGGIALGVERLFMALTGEKDLSRVRAFPVGIISERPLEQGSV